jgi:hypothetical protein
MIHAQRPVAIRALPDLCLGIIFQLGHLRLPTNLVQMASLGPPRARGGSGRLGNASCLRFASMVRAAISAAARVAPHAVMNDVRSEGGRRRKELWPQCDDVGLDQNRSRVHHGARPSVEGQFSSEPTQ